VSASHNLNATLSSSATASSSAPGRISTTPQSLPFWPNFRPKFPRKLPRHRGADLSQRLAFAGHAPSFLYYGMGTMSRKNRTPAFAYLRTSSAANVGVDKRPREAIASFARRAGYELVGNITIRP